MYFLKTFIHLFRFSASLTMMEAPGDVAEPAATGETPNRSRECILHVQKSKATKGKDVLPFTSENWAKVQDTAKVREQKPNFPSSSYYAVIKSLPNNPREHDGYHSTCYKNFTAVSMAPRPGKDPTSDNPSKPLDVSSSTPSAASSRTGIFSKECLFCEKVRKRIKGGQVELTGNCETLEAVKSIQAAAEVLKDNIVFPKVCGGVDLIAKEARYHHSCKSAYVLSASRAEKSPAASTSSTPRGKDAQALSELCAYIEQSVIVNERAELMTSVFEQYVDLCLAFSETPRDSVFSLSRFLQATFKNRIKIQSPPGKRLGSIIHNARISDNAVREVFDYTSTDERFVTRAALLMRKKLLDVEKKSESHSPTLDDLKDGNASPPELVVNFFQVLFGGQKQNREKYSDSVQRRAKSASEDALFIVQRGKVQPQKHVALGMCIKTVTGSKKMVQVLNRFGHCLNYNKLEEVETATAERIQERQLSCPEGTVIGSPMGLAFDNFDELTQTLSGADSLHDTMGILYQNIPDDDTDCPDVGRDAADRGKAPSKGSVTKKSRKRTLDTTNEMAIAPYRKVPKMTRFSYTNSAVYSVPDVSVSAKYQDLLWMMSHAVGTALHPMWIGFNAGLSSTDRLPKQEVRYMPNLKQPITSLDVVQETLLTTQRCAEECQQQYGVVSYDLNAAKPAWQIQITEAPRFDNVFIMPGSFHIEMAFFKALGKLVAESGGPAMLTESDVLAPGSLNGFLTGKHFNRCKRLHPILALAFETLHFRKFLEDYENTDEFITWLDNCSLTTAGDLETAMKASIFVACSEEYRAYTKLTRDGRHGATPQFWMMYVDYIHTFHELERAIRTNDIDLYIQALNPVIGLFFAANHVNYSRWLTKAQLDLLNVGSTHPGLRETLDQGVFSIRRTDNHFSRCPIDLTLEQTVNADAASRLTGMSSFTNNFAARLRWMLTKSTRANFVSLVQDMAGISYGDDTKAELKPSRIRRDNRDLERVLDQIKSNCNPFEEGSSQKKLYNIQTGKACSDEVCQSLLKVPDRGKALHLQFIEECTSDEDRFERPIKKAVLKTFTENGARNKKGADRKVAELKCTRDLMGRLVILAAQRELDLAHIFTYPLTPIPLTMCHPDEALVKTNKDSLLHLLEEKQDQAARQDPRNIACCIIDGQYLLRILPPSATIPPDYGGLARSILSQAIAVQKTRTIVIAFDDYPQPSLKDAERARRVGQEEESQPYIITGPSQRRPKDLAKALGSPSFKRALPEFLAKEWQDDSYAALLGRCEVILDLPSGECYHFENELGKVMSRSIPELQSNHEEADTKVVRHAIVAGSSEDDIGDIVVRAHDTDIAVILLYHCEKIEKTIWLDVGTVSKKTRRFINISAIQKSLGPGISKALPAFHAYTGSDYTSAFAKKGKARPFAKLQQNREVQKAFQTLAEKSVDEKSRKTLLKFTAGLYGAKDNAQDLNKYRYKRFESIYKPKMRTKNPLEKLKGIDASGLPPCEAEVVPHLKRVAFVARMWADADKPLLTQHPSEEDGWTLTDGIYSPVWFEGPQLPETLVPDDEDTGHLSGDDDDMEVASSDEDAEISEDDDGH